jgi:FKBP-type peptidyl-prolyl cis-trans isomerase
MVLGGIAALSACATAGGGSGDPTQVVFSPELGILLDEMTLTPEGLYYRDVVEGMGEEARSNRRVTIHYIGRFPDGTVFDSSVGGEGPVEFLLGEGEVIEGWDLGIRGMKVGGRRVLVIPPRLGYGSRGIRGVVPGNATLVFEVQLVAVNR